MFLSLVVVFAAMTVGFWSDAAVLAAFVGLIAQDHWNHNPLSSAHQVLIVTIFCLIWTAYLLRSERVANTYPRHAAAEEVAEVFG